jgi:hypothetical protein
MITIIGISGKKQAGKDTLCELLLNAADAKGTRIAFADALKEEVAKACGVTVEFINENKEMFRPILQWWGTDFRRKLNGENYWVEKAIVKIHQAVKSGKDLIIIPDVRFRSEALTLLDLGAHVIRVSRPEQTGDTHASETELDNFESFHHIILNTGTIEDLKPEVQSILKLCRVKQKLSKTNE